MALAGALVLAGLTPIAVGAGTASAGDAAPAAGAAAPVVAAGVRADSVVLAGAATPPVAVPDHRPASDAFDPTMRAAVALVLVGLFAATRSRARSPR